LATRLFDINFYHYLPLPFALCTPTKYTTPDNLSKETAWPYVARGHGAVLYWQSTQKIQLSEVLYCDPGIPTYRGELPRSEVPNPLGVGERQARRLVSALLGQKVLNASSPRAPLCLAFPARLAPRWMPGLFPEK